MQLLLRNSFRKHSQRVSCVHVQHILEYVAFAANVQHLQSRSLHFGYGRSREHFWSCSSAVIFVRQYLQNSCATQTYMDSVNDWYMKKRIIYPQVPLFQIKKFSQEEVVVHVPALKRVDFYDLELSGLKKSLIFSGEMQAIEKVQIANECYIMAGLKNGIIEGKSINQSQQKNLFRLSIKDEIRSNAYINDIVDIGDGRIINCYNSGNLAIWNLNKGLCQEQSESYIKSVHQNYVYKLRLYSKGKIVSCGHDKKANLIDLTSNSIISSLYHSQSVWCCYPINQNTLVSAGLMGSLTFWDVRLSRKVQVIKLQYDQTSFITRLSPNQIVFGQQRCLYYCDFRQMTCNRLSNNVMKQSAENILVLPKGGVVAGRGGDISYFKNDGHPQVVQEHIVQDCNPQRIWQSQFLAALLNRQRLAAQLQANIQREEQQYLQQQQQEGELYEFDVQQDEQWEDEDNSQQDQDAY